MQSKSYPSANKILISPVTRNVTIGHISEIFSIYGQVRNVEPTVGDGHGNGQTYQQMIVEYETASEASKAVKYMNGGKFSVVVYPLLSIWPTFCRSIKR